MTAPATSMLPVVNTADSYRMVRDGVTAVLAAVSAVLLLVAIYHVWNATALGTVEGEVPGTLGQALGARAVWPVLVWSGLVGVAGLVGVFLLRQCPVDAPARLSALLGVVQFGLAAALAAIPIYLLATRGFQLAVTPLFIWATFVFLAFVVGGLVLLTTTVLDPVRFRLTVMAIGGAVGLATVLLGFALPLTTYSGTLSGGLEAWRKDWPAVLWPSLAVFGSLVLMFVSLQLGRGLERQNQNVRRLIYGYNAFLTGLLLLSVLSLVNVLAYAEPFTRFFGQPLDWTATNLNALSPAMRTILADLKEPVKVYSFLPRSNPIEVDTRTMLDNCRSLTPKFTWEFIARSVENSERIAGMMEKYSISDPLGILVLVGSESDKGQPAFTFIKAADLYKEQRDPRNPRDAGGYTYTGEPALLGALQSMLEGKMTIYLTQGHGEWSPDGDAPAMPPMRARAPSGPLSVLRRKLTDRRGVEVKTLTLDRTTKAVPDDASVVVVVRPTVPFGKEEVAVLRDYVRRNRQAKKTKDKAGKESEEEAVTAGRLMLLLEPVVQREGGSSTLVPTGLEPLLTEYNVKLGDNRILNMIPQLRNPLDGLFVPPRESPNSIARAFGASSAGQQRQFVFTNCRTVEPIAEQGGGKTVDRLLLAPWQYGFWAEPNFSRDPVTLAETLRNDPAEANKKIIRATLCVAVAVSDQGDGGPGAPRDAAHAGLMKETPRMVVFGTASWVNNESLSGGRGESRMDLFSSCVSWLREKTALGEGGAAAVKERKPYDVGLPPQQQTRLTWLPLGLMLLGIVGLGTGVWVVRRR